MPLSKSGLAFLRKETILKKTERKLHLPQPQPLPLLKSQALIPWELHRFRIYYNEFTTFLYQVSDFIPSLYIKDSGVGKFFNKGGDDETLRPLLNKKIPQSKVTSPFTV